MFVRADVLPRACLSRYESVFCTLLDHPAHLLLLRIAETVAIGPPSGVLLFIHHVHDLVATGFLLGAAAAFHCAIRRSVNVPNLSRPGQTASTFLLAFL
jgi:hypothetical protein